MNIPKAIEILTDYQAGVEMEELREYPEVVQLGIKALTYIERLCACSFEHRQAWLHIANPYIDTSRSEHAIKDALENPPGRAPEY